MLQLAGTPVSDRDIFELARALHVGGFTDVANKLEKALTLGTAIVGLTISDRESILRALYSPTSVGLSDLRAVLMDEHEGRVQQGLS